MVSRSLKKGSFLLLFPEDVSTDETAPFYVVVKSARKTKTVVTKLTTDDSTGAELSLDPSIALPRVVAARDASGLKLGTWLRKAVCVQKDGSFRHGQVVDYEDDAIVVRANSERFTVGMPSGVTEVYPVVAMVMQARDWQLQEWTLSDIEGIHDALIDSLLGATRLDSDPAWISVADWVRKATPHISPDPNAVFSWVEPDTGMTCTVSLSHVVNYVYYVTGQGRVPPALRRRLGHSFCDDPSPTSAEEASGHGPDREPEGHGPDPRIELPRPMDPSLFLFEPDVVDDEEEQAQDERDTAADLGAPPLTTPAPTPRTCNQVHHDPRRFAPASNPDPSLVATSGTAVTDLDAELDFLDQLRRTRPHLVARYLDRSRAESGSAKRPRLENTHASPPVKRGRYEFSPSPQQELVHDMITGESHLGTSGFMLVEMLMAQTGFRFRVYPGVLVRAYDFQFGSRGLSILHFKPLGYKEGLLAQRNATVSMTDFSAAAAILPPPSVASWADLASAVSGLMQYCVFCCDDTTQALVKALQSFVLEAEQWKLWHVSELPTLELWINSTLEKYRAAVIADGSAGLQTRHAVAAEFSVFNPQLQALLLADRITPGTVNREVNPVQSIGGPTNVSRVIKSERKVPADVLAVLPRQHGKELCLRHLSKRGCLSLDPARCVNPARFHSQPATLPTQITAHVKSHFGGLCEQYKRA